MDKKIVLELTVEQLNVVMSGLAELPVKTGLGVFQFIQMEASKQLNPQPQGPLTDKVVN